MIRKCAVALFTLFLLSQETFAQQDKQPRYVQFSGIVLTHDSLRAVSYAVIGIVRTNKRTAADGDGFFNFVAREGDSIFFSAIGYKPVYTVIPVKLQSSKYSWIQLMREDTFMLPEVHMKPWPSKREIDKFLATGTVDNNYELALDNTDQKKLARLERTMPMDAGDNQRTYMNYQAAKYYYSGQAPPLRVLDPFAWASFFKAWKAGKLKNPDK